MPNTSGLPTRAVMQELLERALPGTSPSVTRLREQIIDVASSLTARTMLLRGPIGVGKSTIARLIALLKRVALLNVADASRILNDAKFDGPNRIDIRYLWTWYVELALTGLVDSLAEVQLFGAVKGAYTDAKQQRSGVFEQAMNGRTRGGTSAGAKLTGGVVFLDEVGDLNATLQAKLLPVLSGGAFYRIGGEGDPAHELRFNGVAIGATWRNVDAGTLRPDLLSRLGAYVIDVPGIDERAEDFDALFDAVQDALIDSMKAAIHQATVVEPMVDRAYWNMRKDALGPVPPPTREQLSRVPWARHGHLRGLTAALEQILATGADADRVIRELPTVTVDEPGSDAGLLGRLLQRHPNGQGLAGHLRVIEIEQRRDLRDQLLGDLRARRAVGQRLGIPERHLVSQIHQLDRRRQRPREERP